MLLELAGCHEWIPDSMVPSATVHRGDERRDSVCVDHSGSWSRLIEGGQLSRRSLRTTGVFLCVGLLAAACGSSSKKSTTATTAAGAASTAPKSSVKVGLVFDLTGRGDKSFNDSAATGLDKAQKELGVEVKDLTPNADGSNREQLLRQLADLGYNPIIAVGFLFADSVKKVATDKTATKFAVIDDSSIQLPNVTGLTFAEEQGSFLVGAAAALKSKTSHVGFVGGVDNDLIHKFEAGYNAGAKAVNPSIKIDKKYLTVPPDFTGFKDPAKGKEAATAMYAGGADVVYAAAGLSGTGVFAAAKDASTGSNKLWAIGVDSDQYLQVDPATQPLVLTSMVKHVDVAVFNYIKSFQDANGNVQSTHIVFDLKNDGVGYATSGGFVDDIKSKLETYKQQIISGQITVPTTP
jgi:basic membrane protein A